MLKPWDTRRDYIIPGNKEETVDFAAGHWVHSAKRSIQKRGRFAVALSGGSTPKAIFELLVEKAQLDWTKIWLFWSDERAVPPNHPDSNYRMAMESFTKVPIPQSQIHRMVAEDDIEKNAMNYEEKIYRIIGKDLFDLVMLGVGEDGHTASLFPNTEALGIKDKLVTPNFIPEKKTWRMSLTFPCINQSFHSVIYAIGENKKLIVPKVLKAAVVSEFPSSRIGTSEHKALWILDKSSSVKIN